MKERGMIFNGEMVRALLNGNKTQTRRPIKPRPLWVYGGKVPVRTEDADPKGEIRCPFGQVGDQIWVRETFRLFDHSDECGASAHCSCPPSGTPIYRADFDDAESKWTPSIHMPRWASRILLEITNIRVQQLQDISEQDAISEGVNSDTAIEQDDFGQWCGGVAWRNYLESEADYDCVSARDSFTTLWESLYGNWDENPWVWVIEFKRIAP